VGNTPDYQKEPIDMIEREDLDRLDVIVVRLAGHDDEGHDSRV